MAIIWGQHRTEELLALDVKEDLERELDVPFVEYALWEPLDYIPWLRTLVGRGRDNPETWHRDGQYHESLASNYGSNSLNLHDTLSWEPSCQAVESQTHPGRTPEIGFFLPLENYDRAHLRTERLLADLAQKNDVPITVLGPVEEPTITVEFFVPPDMKTISEEVEELFSRAQYIPFFMAGPRKHLDFYKVTDRAHPGYQAIREKYSSFMKQVVESMAK